MDKNKRKEILKNLIISEEDTLARFEQLINKSTKLFRISSKNVEIIYENYNFSNVDKVLLFLIGKYFAKELELINSYTFSISEISRELSIKATTLSAPLGQLVSSGYVSNKDRKYYINHYKISEILDSLINKYNKQGSDNKYGLSLKKRKTTYKKRSANKNSAKKDSYKKEKKLDEESVICFSTNPKGISDLVKDLGTSEGKIKSVFEFEENALHLLYKKHHDKDAQETFLNSLIYLTGFYYYFNQREINANKLLRALRDVNVKIPIHFKRDMNNKKRRPFIMFKGGNVYKITEQGIKEGLKLIKEML